MTLLIGIVLVAFLIYFFTDGGFGTARYFGPPENIPLERYEEVTVNVLYRQGDQGFYLGKVVGATACRELAYKHAETQNLTEGTTWSYVCCTEEGQSMCDRRLK